jgi:hypothetical protein
MDFKSKKEKIKELSNSIGIWSSKEVEVSKVREINNLKERLIFKLKKLEEKGLDEKIKTMEKVLSILKDEKGNNKKDTK